MPELRISGLQVHHLKCLAMLSPLLFLLLYLFVSAALPVVDPGEAPPLILRPNWGRKGQRIFLWRPSPPALSKALDERAPLPPPLPHPLPPPPYLHVWICHWLPAVRKENIPLLLCGGPEQSQINRFQKLLFGFLGMIYNSTAFLTWKIPDFFHLFIFKVFKLIFFQGHQILA